jgi:hypothetical protein
MLIGEFATAFWPTLAATILGGGVVAAGAYWFLDRKLHLHDNAARAKQAEEGRKDVREAVLRVARGELEFAAARLTTYGQALGSNLIPYPPFDTNGWTLLSQAHAITTIKAVSTEKLINAYNRIRSFNELLIQYIDLTHGGTGTLFHITATTTANAQGELPPVVDAIIGQYNAFKTMSSDGLRARLTDLTPHLHQAIDAVKAELGVIGDPPSAQIRYRAPTEPMTMMPVSEVR